MSTRVFALACLQVLALAAACDAQELPITIGVLTDMSGSSSDFAGPGSVAATQMAVDEIGGRVIGRPIRVIYGDHQLKPDVAASIARRWYDEDKVDLIVDVPVSPAGLAVQTVSNEKRRMFITTATLTSDFTGKFCTPYSMQWNFNTVVLARATTRAAMARGLKNWFFLTADYAFGIALERDAERVVEENGGRVLGSVRHPYNTPDLTSFLLQAMASQAQAIGLANGPPDTVSVVREASEFGLKSSEKTLIGFFVLLTDIHALGLELGQGLVLTDSFYWDRDDASRAWAGKFAAKMGKMPTSVQAADYSATRHWLRAVEAAGTTDAEIVAAKMRDMPVEDIFTAHGVIRKDGSMVHDMYLLQVKTPQQSHGEWDLYNQLATVEADNLFPSIKDGGCPLTR